MKTVARCGIYETRPELCRVYPAIHHWTPSECTYAHSDSGQRSGECSCEVGACCNTPRAGGEPTGSHLPESAGGLPCKHLQWVDEEDPEETEKIASRLDVNPLLRILD